MKTPRGRARWLTRSTMFAALIVALVALPSFALAAPTAPSVKDATVYQGGTGVTIWWTPSTDTQAGSIQYQVYRDDVPMTIGNYAANGELVTTTSDTTVTVTPKADELTKKFTYYYMIVATNTTTGNKAVSANIVPNVHGGLRNGYQTYNCQLCHNVHGAPPEEYLGAATRYKCYRCHGTTTGSTNYGDKAVRNVQRDFFDYTSGQTIPTTVSRHYNQVMSDNETECTTCHTPHKSPYYVDPATGVKLDASSYTQLLRAEITAGSYYYSTDAVPSGNTFCLQCHGANTTTLDFNAGAGTYTATSGDHTYAPGAVHNETIVYTNNDTHATNPGIQCLACHNKHASAVDKLIDYRSSGTSTTENNQAGLCFKCHRASTTETRVAAGYAAPYAWNARDLYAQFAKAASGGSSHPMTAGSGRWTPDSGEVFSQDTDTEFASDTLSQAVVNTADGDGSVVLDQEAIVTPIASNPYVLVSQASATGNTDSYLAGDAAWNEDFNPTSIGTNPGSGANSTTKNSVVFAMQGGASNVLRTYTPPANSGTGTWGTATNLWQTANTGSDMAFDSTDNYIWALVGGYTPVNASNAATNIRRTTNFSGTTVAWYDDGTGTGEDGPYFCTTANTPLRLGAGATLAWVPANGTRPERLYAVNRDGTTTRNGQLYFFDNPDAASGGAAWTSSTHVLGTTGTTSDTGSRSAYFRIGTTDYIYFLRGAANVEYLIQLANTTAAAGTVLDNGTANPWNGNTGDGCSIVWNGDTTQAGFRLYATRGGNAGTSFKVATWNGSALVWGDGPNLAANSTAGTYLSYATCDPADPSTLQYYASGTVTTPDVTMPSARPTAWDEVTFTKNQPANTTLTVTVQGWNGSAWVDLTTSGSSPIDVSGYPVAAYAKLRLRANLATTAPLTATPRLDEWAVTAAWEDYESGSYVPQAFTAFSQPAPTTFSSPANNTLSDTVISANTVVLNQFNQSTPIPPELYLFSQRAASMVIDAYEYDTGTGGTWNTPYNPTDETSFNTATGSNLFSLGGDIYRTRGGNSTTLPMIRKYTLGTDTNGAWGNTAMATAFNSGFNTGSDVADNAASSVVYISQAGNSNVINWWQYSGATENSMTFSGGTIGIGSSIAYTPDADRLWVILRNGTAGAGTLWHLAAPGIKTGAQTFTNTAVVAGPSGATSYYGDMCYFEDSTGTDYLASMGRDGTSRFFHVLSGLGGTPTRLRLTGVTKEPSGGGTYADGCSIVWDGVPGGYLYAQTTATTRLMRIKIPDNPTVDGGATGWGTWEAVTNLPANMGAGSALAFATVDRPGSAVVPNYYGSGTVTTAVDILPVVGSDAWGTVAWTETLPADTDISVKVQGWNGSAWVDLTTSSSSPIDMSGYSITTYTKLKLIGTLSTTAPLTSTPVLTGWTVTSTKPVWQASGSVTCVNCHNTHTVARGGTTPWDMTRVSDPDSTKDAYTGTPTQFCLECHDESAPSTALNDADILVPYNVGFRTFDSATSPFWPGWNKKAAGTSFENSAHATTAIPLLVGDIGCQTCHDPHASDNARLTAYSYDQDTAPAPHSGTVVRNNTSTYDEQNLCYACHDTQSGALCTGGACHPGADIRTLNARTPIEQTYGHPVTRTDRHSDLETASDLGPAATDRHAECVDCHDPHAAKAMTNPTNTSVVDGPLVGATGVKPTYLSAPPSGTWNPAPSYTGASGQVFQTLNDALSYSPERMDGEADDFEAYVCFKCHSSYAIPTFTSSPYTVTLSRTTGTYTATDIAMEFNPSNYSWHNVLGQSVTPSGSATSQRTTHTFVDSAGTTQTRIWDLPADAWVFKTGYTRTSKVTCTDCHTNETVGQAKGPHGSTGQWLIDPKYSSYRTARLVATGDTDGDGISGQLASAGTTPICAKCHDLYNGSFAHSPHSDSAFGVADGGSHDVECVTCHIAIPHGWKRPRLLVRAGIDPAPYADPQALLTGVQANVDRTWNGSTVGGTGENGPWGRDACSANGCSNTHSTSPVWQ